MEVELKDPTVFDDSAHKAPKDKYYLVYIMLFLIGVGTLLPWNFFITIIPYFQFKLGNTSVPDGKLSNEQAMFGNYLGLCSMIPLSISMIVNLVIMKYLSAFVRFTIGSLTVFLMFVITLILVKVSLDSKTFLIVTLLSVIAINCGTALFQGSVFGIVASLPQRNMKACIEGQAIAGVIAAVANIASIAVSPHPTDSALGYFLFALVFLGIAIGMTYMLKVNAYFKYYWNQQHAEQSNDSNQVHEVKIEESLKSVVWHSLKDVWVHGLSVLLCLMITLSLFPAILQPIRSMNFSDTDTWSSKYFTPVIVFLSFNFWDLVGRILAGHIKWPNQKQKWLLIIFCVARVALIPIGMLMNQNPKKHMPVVFRHDAFPIILVVLLGLSNGYLLSLAMMYGPSYAKPERAEGAGVALSIYLALGLSLGVALSYVLALAL